MTYEEALKEKQEAMKTVMETGNNYLYIIMPELVKDQIDFDNEFDESTYTDELCKKFCSNNQYIVVQQMDKDSINREDRRSKNLGK